MLKRVAFATALLVVGCTALVAQQIDTTVVTVKLTRKEQVSLRALNAEIANYARLWASQGKTLSDQDKTSILWRMIDMILFRQAAERDSVEVTDAQLSAAIAQAKQALSTRLGREATDADLRSQVTQGGTSWEAWTASVKDQMLPQVYTAHVRAVDLQKVPLPSESDIEWYYQTNIQQFVVATTVEFKHIYANTTGATEAQAAAAKARLEAALKRIKAGEPFESLVKDNSDDTETRDRDGYSGFLRLDSAQAKALGRDFVQGVLKLKEGQVSDVLSSPAGYHIVKVIRVIPAKLCGINEELPPAYQQTPADAIRQLLHSSAQQAAIDAAIDKTRNELRQAAEIVFSDADIGFKRTP